MLTPIDQPLDKLEDLAPEEMSAFFFLFPIANVDAAVLGFLSPK